jgi:ribose 5-phosphate isomerase RpiB
MTSRTNKTRTVFQSTKAVLSATADIAVTTATTTADVVGIGGSIIANNMQAMRVATVRDNTIENAQEVEESLNVCDEALDALEAKLAEKGLTPRQKARLQLRIQMWEATAVTVEATTKF